LRVQDGLSSPNSAVFQPLNRSLDRPRRQLGSILTDAGQIDCGQLCQRGVVVASHRNVLWNRESGTAQGVDDAKRTVVVEGRDCRRQLRTSQQFLRGVPPVSFVAAATQDDRATQNSVPPEALFEAGSTSGSDLS